jgi:RNA polymerase sigma factor (sigma-70 family)
MALVPDGRHDDPEERRPGFEAFYREVYRAVVNAAFMTTRDMPTAEDAAQDAFVDIARTWSTWVDKPWEQKVAHAKLAAVRRSIDDRRRSGRLRRTLDRVGPWVGSFTHVESDVMARDLVRLVLEIPSRQQRAIAVLAFLQDLSAEQIGHELGIKASTVRTVILRLRERFRAAHVEVDADRGVEQVGRKDL